MPRRMKRRKQSWRELQGMCQLAAGADWREARAKLEDERALIDAMVREHGVLAALLERAKHGDQEAHRELRGAEARLKDLQERAAAYVRRIPEQLAELGARERQRARELSRHAVGLRCRRPREPRRARVRAARTGGARDDGSGDDEPPGEPPPLSSPAPSNDGRRHG